MTVRPGEIALVTGGLPANLGKIVYVAGPPVDRRLPCLGGHGEPCWEVHMTANGLFDRFGIEVFGGKIAESALLPLGVDGEIAAAIREGGMLAVVERAIAEDAAEAAGMAPPPSPPCYFVFGRSAAAQLPAGALACPLSVRCARRLAQTRSVHIIPFAAFADSQWRVRIFPAEAPSESPDDLYEGVATTSRIAELLPTRRVEVIDGPYDSSDDAWQAHDDDRPPAF